MPPCCRAIEERDTASSRHISVLRPICIGAQTAHTRHARETSRRRASHAMCHVSTTPAQKKMDVSGVCQRSRVSTCEPPIRLWTLCRARLRIIHSPFSQFRRFNMVDFPVAPPTFDLVGPFTVYSSIKLYSIRLLLDVAGGLESHVTTHLLPGAIASDFPFCVYVASLSQRLREFPCTHALCALRGEVMGADAADAASAA